MKKLFTAVLVLVALMMASKTTFASEIIINDPDVQVIVEKGDSPLSNIKGRVDHYTDIYTYGLSRPMSAHNLVKGYNFGVSASASDIYSNYYFTNLCVNCKNGIMLPSGLKIQHPEFQKITNIYADNLVDDDNVDIGSIDVLVI